MIEDSEFKELIKRIIGMYQISPETSAELLQQILQVLASAENASGT